MATDASFGFTMPLSVTGGPKLYLICRLFRDPLDDRLAVSQLRDLIGSKPE